MNKKVQTLFLKRFYIRFFIINLSTLGTESRDLWKAAAHAYSSSPNQALLDRAQIGALCGNSEPLLQIATSWEDRLWALLKGYVDVAMEEHIRSGKEILFKLLLLFNHN